MELLSPSCESEGPPVYMTSPMTPILTSTPKMEAACSPETFPHGTNTQEQSWDDNEPR